MALQENEIITPEALVQRFQEVVVNNILKDVYHSGRPPVKSGYTLVPISIMDHIDNVPKVPSVGAKDSTVNAAIILQGLINLTRNLTRVGSFVVTVWYKSSRGGVQNSSASVHEIGSLSGKILFNTGYIRNSFTNPPNLEGVVYGGVIRASGLNQLFHNIYTHWANTDREKYMGNIQMCHDSCHYNCHCNCHCSCHCSCHGWDAGCHCHSNYDFPAPSIKDNPSGSEIPYPTRPDTTMAPAGEESKWKYTLEGNNIILSKFNDFNAENVIVYDKYNVNGNIYNTKLAEDSSQMFYYKYRIKSITFGHNVDTSNVTDMSGMFYYCEKLETLDLGNNFNTSNVRKMRNMFLRCSNMSIYPLVTMDTHNVTDCECLYEIFGSYLKRDSDNVPTRNPAIIVSRSKWTITKDSKTAWSSNSNIARINYIDD